MSTLTVQPTQYSLTVEEDGLGIVSVGVQGPAGPAGAAGAQGPAGPNQLLTGQTLWADVDGNDGTAARGDAAKPFATLTAAAAAWQAGDVVHARPGTYADVELSAPGVTYHFEPGAGLVNPTVGGSDAVIFRFASAGTYRVYGRGTILNDWSNPVGSSHAGADYLIECESITTRDFPYPAVAHSDGTGVVRGAVIRQTFAELGTVLFDHGSLTLDRCTVHDSDTAPCVEANQGPGLVLRDCRLVGATPFEPGSFAAVEGTLTVDAAPDPSVTLTGGFVVVAGGPSPVVGADGVLTAAGFVGDGSGLTGVSGSSDLLSPLTSAEVSVTGATTATLGRLHVCSGTTADYTVTLPTAVGNAGKLVAFRFATTLTKRVTLDGNGSETVAGAASRVFWAGEAVALVSDGANWQKLWYSFRPMYATMQRTSALSVGSSSVTSVPMNSTVADPSGLMADTTNGRIVAPRTGTYRINAVLVYNSLGAANNVQVRVNKNGSLLANDSRSNSAGGFPAPRCVPPVSSLTVGDLIAVDAYQTSGSSADLFTTDPNTLSVEEEPSW